MSAPRIPGGYSPGGSAPESGPKPGLHRGFEPYFAPSETLIWQGHPSGRFSFMSCGGVPILLFSLVVGIFALGWNAMVWIDGGPQLFRLMGGIFLAFGLYAVFGQYVLDMLRRRKTLYAVTNQRVYTLETFLRRKLTTYPLRDTTPVRLEGNTVLIGPHPPRGPVLKTQGDTRAPATDGITLRMIDDAPELYSLILGTDLRPGDRAAPVEEQIANIRCSLSQPPQAGR